MRPPLFFRPIFLHRFRSLATASLLSFVLGLLLAQLAPAARAAGSPALLQTQNFLPVTAEGFGDRQNSWAWAMDYWNGKLYVGTNRSYGCITAWEFVVQTGTTAGYPPRDRDLNCPTSPGDISEAAEIWSLDPNTSTWTNVFTSPTQNANGSCIIPNQSYPGTCLPLDQGFRTAADFQDPVLGDTLYFGGVNTQAMGFNTSPQVPPPRLLYTTDGVNFTAVPQDSGTVLGSLTGASWRGLTSYNGQLFGINGTVQGNGPIYASSNPSAGDNAWQLVSPSGLSFYDMAVFNGWLYVGLLDTANGYSVMKTQATGSPPYQFQTVVPPGAFVLQNPSQSVVSMHVFDGRLYIGTAEPSEIIRINPDDTWDVVVGPPRTVDGVQKYPLSGLNDGFDNDLNLHIWRMADHAGELLAGTYDATVRYRNNATLLSSLLPQMGFDLWGTSDGWYWNAVTTTGFGNPFDYGVRNMVDTPFGLFLGTANEYYGLNVFRGDQSLDKTPYVSPGSPPTRLQVETRNGEPILSWDPVPFASAYHVYRETIVQLTLPPNPPFNNGGPANIPGPYTEITPSTGTPDTVYVDSTAASGTSYLYFVSANSLQSAITNPSNVVLAPGITPPPTFTSVQGFINQLNQRNRFVSSAEYTTAVNAINQAQMDVTNGDLSDAYDQLTSLRTADLAGSVVQSPDSTDFEILLEQMSRRIKLAQNGFIDPSTLN